MSTILFRPSQSQMEQTQLSDFAKRLDSQAFDHNYSALHQYSISHLSEFWRAVWEFGNVQGTAGDVVLGPEQMPDTQWFPNAKLNFANNLLHHGDDDKNAIVAVSESRETQEISYRQLRQNVMQLAAYLQQECGVKPKDVVAGYIGNTQEALIGMLATTYLGAIWTSASPDFGYEGVFDRLGQVKPVVLLAGNGYGYGGKLFDRREVIDQLRTSVPSIRNTIDVSVVPSIASIEQSTALEDILKQQRPAPELIEFPFDHPLVVLYSSGTTGKPKCIIHSAGGTLLQHIKELRLHGDISKDSTFFYYTTTGWMMWNWLASGLVTGATLILYDGNPMHPTESVLWELAAKYGVTHFGTSAKYLSACQKLGVNPKENNLDTLRVVFSTGSPLSPEDFDWVYDRVKSDVMLHSISGGTDIVSCFVGGNPWSPVVKGKIQAANLGMAVESWNDEGESVLNQRGELVCRLPAPCMPIGFWNDPDKVRYKSAYFERFDKVWAQGDFCEIDEQGQVVILGRSDTTLNPGGVRIGTAEIYRQVETIEQVTDSLVVGHQTDNDVEVVLFVKLNSTSKLDDALKSAIKQRIRQNTTPRHVPKHIFAVTDIPYTRSGKKVELAVTQILRGDAPKNTTAMANAECLVEYQEIKVKLLNK
jgi:acetoacetyl-CoA synthetase